MNYKLILKYKLNLVCIIHYFWNISLVCIIHYFWNPPATGRASRARLARPPNLRPPPFGHLPSATCLRPPLRPSGQNPSLYPSPGPPNPVTPALAVGGWRSPKRLQKSIKFHHGFWMDFMSQNGCHNDQKSNKTHDKIDIGARSCFLKDVWLIWDASDPLKPNKLHGRGIKNQ